MKNRILKIISKRRRLKKMNKDIPKQSKTEIYDKFFHDSRFPIVEKRLSPKNAEIFKSLSNEDKAMFINILIDEGVLSW